MSKTRHTQAGWYCLGGDYPALTGHVGPQRAFKCPANTDSPAGSKAATDCTPVPGYYAAADRAVVQCPYGKYCQVRACVRARVHDRPGAMVALCLVASASCLVAFVPGRFRFYTHTHTPDGG